MSESANHKRLVEIIIEYVGEKVGCDYVCFIESDIADEHPLPPMMEDGYRPDVFFEYDGTMIIGEAKTSDDISRQHSLCQYASYLRKCSLYSGNAEFVIAVPWIDQASANNILKKLKKEFPGDYSIKVLKGML